jgi:glutamate formiminotransferase
VTSAVINIAEGRDLDRVDAIARCAGIHLLDTHSDPFHNRSVLTLAGPDLLEAALAVARATVALVPFTGPPGVHPALGAIDVVPFVPVGEEGFGDGIDLSDALALRNAFAEIAGRELELPCFLYGSERTLPAIRKGAFATITPDTGPGVVHPTAGACCVGARPCLVAYNIVLATPDLALAREIARAVRGPDVRALGLPVGAEVQVSCNLVAPWRTGPAEIVDAIGTLSAVRRTECVGLVPRALLSATPEARWGELDLDPDRTIESRLSGST